MVRITIDTEKDSTHTIQKIMALLSHFASGSQPAPTIPQSFSQEYNEPARVNAPQESAGYTDMFATMPSSEPVKTPSNNYSDMFAPSAPVNQFTENQNFYDEPVKTTTSSFFDMASSNVPSQSTPTFSPTTTISQTPSTTPSDGMFDMFASEPTPPSTTLTDSSADSLLSSVSDYPSVFDDYTEEQKKDFSAKDYLKLKEYEE